MLYSITHNLAITSSFFRTNVTEARTENNTVRIRIHSTSSNNRELDWLTTIERKLARLKPAKLLPILRSKNIFLGTPSPMLDVMTWRHRK